jgi:two-component system sensor histidine kinase QseC
MRSIRKSLLLGLLAGLGLLWLVAGLAVFLTVRRNLEGTFDAELRAMASEVRYLIPEGRYLQEPEPSAYWFEFFQLNSGLYFQVWDEYLLFSDRSPSLAEMDLPRPDAFSTQPKIWNVTLSTGEETRAIARQFALNSGLPGDALASSVVNIVVARNRTALTRSLNRLLAATVFAGGLMVPVSFLLVHIVLGWGLRPLRALTEHVASRSVDSLHERFPTAHLPGELVPVAERLNELMERMEAGIERERRLNADLAHELKTPVAELRAMAEVAMTWPDRLTGREAAEVLGVAKQMQWIIENMLLLARWDRDAERPPFARVLVDDMLNKCWPACSGRAGEKGLRVVRDLPPDLALETNPELLQVVLNNLLSNAVEYCPEGGDLRIQGLSMDGRFRLTVANTVRHLREEDIEHIFERFWRHNTTRKGEGHAGLGLSVARSCAGVLGLRLSAELDEPAGLVRFSLFSDPDMGPEGARAG